MIEAPDSALVSQSRLSIYGSILVHCGLYDW